MITRFLLSFIVCVLALSLSGYSQDQSEGEITGTIKSLDNVLPWQMVLALVPVEGGALSRLAEVKSDGSFRFTKVGKGTYRIQSNKAAGYVWTEITAQLLQTRKWVAGEQANLEIVKGGVITGKVTQLTGRPSYGLKVQAIPTDTSSKASFSSFTDDLGNYRIYGLPPGKYLLTAYPKEPGKAAVYYPATTRPRATEIEINVGEERSGIDIQLLDLNGWAISGKVVPALGGKKPIKLKLLYDADSTEANVTFSAVQGSFIFTGIPNQDYLLMAEEEGEANKIGAVSKPQKISMRSVDIANVTLPLMPLTSLQGNIVIDPVPSTCQETIKLATSNLTATQNIPALPKEFTKASTQPDKSGSFRLAPLLSGEYTLSFSGSSFGYIKRVTRQNVALSPQRIPSFSNATSLSVSVGYGGIVKLKSDAGSQARLFNESGQIVEFALQDEKGFFNFSPLAPGKYSILLSARAIDEAEAVRLFRTKPASLINVLIQACKVEVITQTK